MISVWMVLAKGSRIPQVGDDVILTDEYDTLPQVHERGWEFVEPPTLQLLGARAKVTAVHPNGTVSVCVCGYEDRAVFPRGLVVRAIEANEAQQEGSGT
jgi:hypothetical protein